MSEMQKSFQIAFGLSFNVYHSYGYLCLLNGFISYFHLYSKFSPSCRGYLDGCFRLLITGASPLDVFSCSKSFKVGKKGATVSVECFWDETDTNGQIALAEGSSVAMDLFPEGTDSSDYYYSGTWLVTANSVSIPTDGIIEATFSATLTGNLSRSTV